MATTAAEIKAVTDAFFAGYTKLQPALDELETLI